VPVNLLEILRCPFCRAPLDEVGDGLACCGCGRAFGRSPDGIPLMLHEDLPGAREKLKEAEGWVDKARAEGWYDPDDAVDAVLPFPNRELGWDDLGWLSNGHSFQLLLDRYVGERRGLRVLEVGAAKGWAAPYWSERGCEYVATDILVDPNIGLGRGAFYGEFGRVQADGEHLPFADATFDVTYAVAALHHALNLPQMLLEMARVTKRGGVVAGLNEGTRGVTRPVDSPDQAGEKELGINEHVHTPWAYVRAFASAGLVVRRLERADGWPPRPYGRLLSQIPKIGPSLGTFVHLSASHYAGLSIYARRR
jgi:ubiquinone/menaquinone biosynthesis C-methylase UbiE/uncharacterized protein YbaR (Trm112 family)